MNRKNLVKSGVNTVMGVNEATRDTTIRPDLANPQWDKAATLIYLGATIAQIAAMTGLLWAMDFALGYLDTAALPQGAMGAIACAFFAVVTLRSRFFSLLDNTRNSGRYQSLQRPGWAPPPLAFPIVWMSIAVLRVVSTYLVWSAMGQTFLCLPLILYVAHLSLGDTWNTIFTVEGRLGAAVPMVIVGPLLSAAVVTISYYQTLPLAGWIILPSLVWLAIATALCISLWRLNGQEPLYPVVSTAES
ncbi:MULTISPECIES: TspO/MBR family protein [Cyanophyceae]|uniref:Tryptophan-rich sensory protein n=1 Tax=Leptolyngbya subtilissima DQ-A4 TaxID=2933933 RepID=A0ABV0K3G7_9CYAN|nr:tryptophan-rich sensory protein [Nodosilinea sp. FACHB-141]MBD2111262.1 tryptophan-rich sensory protein [Nodosilinea sp. FACHB-141]